MYVHSEAEYAFNKQKPTLTLRLEAGYRPDGWLGLLCLNSPLYDFSVPQNFDDEWQKLHAKLTKMNLGVSGPDTGSSVC